MENTNVQTVQPEQKHKSTQPVYAKATSVQRWIASFIDNIVFQVAIGIFFIVPEFFFKYKQIYGESWYQYFIELFLVSYLLWKFGATPGKMLLRIKVVD